jgi:hypothetical protein
MVRLDCTCIHEKYVVVCRSHTCRSGIVYVDVCVYARGLCDVCMSSRVSMPGGHASPCRSRAAPAVSLPAAPWPAAPWPAAPIAAVANPRGFAVLTDCRNARGPEQAEVEQTTTRPGSRLRAHGANPHAPGAQGVGRSGDDRAAAGAGIRICVGPGIRICGLGRRLRICVGPGIRICGLGRRRRSKLVG